MFTRREIVWGAAVGTLLPLHLTAATRDASAYVVKMYNVDPKDSTRRMVFSPRVLRVPRGATVRFVPSDPGHNSQSIDGMTPSGAAGWRGPFGQPYSVKLDTPGYYGYRCLAHGSAGMVGLVIVGGEEASSHRAAAQSVKHPGRSAAVWAAIWAEVAAGDGGIDARGSTARSRPSQG